MNYLPSGNPAQVSGGSKQCSFRMGEQTAGQNHKTKFQINALVRLEQFGVILVQALIMRRVDVDNIRRNTVQFLKGLCGVQNMIQHDGHSRKCVDSGVMLIPDYLIRITATLNSCYTLREDQVINAILTRWASIRSTYYPGQRTFCVA